MSTTVFLRTAAGVLLAAGAAAAVWAAASPQPLDAGANAPQFALADQSGKTHRLADYKGRWVVLAFYPADSTSGCTLEARSMTRVQPQMESMRVAQFGVSVQDSTSKAKFCDAEGLTHTLLADVTKDVSRAYGVLNPAGLSNRVTFIIDPSGKIARRMDSVNVNTHGEDLLAALKELGPQSDAPTYRPRTEGLPELKPGARAPEFNLPNLLQQGNVSLKQTLAKQGTKGAAVIWVSLQCPVSQAYEGRMKQIASEFKNRGIAVIGIASNATESEQDLEKYFRGKAPGFPVLRDAQNRIADEYGAKVTPEVFLVDTAGLIRFHGAIDDSQDAAGVKQSFLRQAIEDILAGRSVKTPTHKAFGCSLKRVKKDG